MLNVRGSDVLGVHGFWSAIRAYHVRGLCWAVAGVVLELKAKDCCWKEGLHAGYLFGLGLA